MIQPQRVRNYPGVFIALLALGAALLACTASWGADGSGAGDISGGGAGGAGSVPGVVIRSPTSGQQVPANQPVDVLVESDSTATAFQMNVGNQVASLIALPPDQTGPASAILTWTPDRPATYTIQVYALNGPAVSLPAVVDIVVVPGAAGSAAGDAGSGCTARVMVSELNYRDGPGTNANKLGQFATGETLIVVGRNADGSWYRAQRANGEAVWVINNAQWLEIAGTCDALPVTG